MSQTVTRSHHCNELTEKWIDKKVTLCGWVDTRRDHGGLIFIDLRDRYGLTQVVFDPKLSPSSKEAHALAQKLRSEFVVQVTGMVRGRPTGMKNPDLVTGGIEVACDQLRIFSEAKTPPFVVGGKGEVSENLRLKYRYLDLRNPSLQKNLIIRHQMISIARNHLSQEGFLEIETPMLYKSTPEGARDFVVPSRMNPGTFYALPQSPQTLKQLLMISGMDRYYQIARCFRDEDLRADRQPEFSQIDIEASFVDEEVLFPIMESMVSKIWKEILGQQLKTPFRRMHYDEAMNRYGSDKPDLRFKLEIQDFSEIFRQSTFKVFSQTLKNGGHVKGLIVKGVAEQFSRKDLEDLETHAKLYGAKGLLWIKWQKNNEIQSPAAKFFVDSEKAALVSQFQIEPGDLVLMASDLKNKTVCTILGAVRLYLASKLKLISKDAPYEFLWVTHFPLFEFDEEMNRYFACHHPFTSPRPECFQDFLLGKNLDDLKASAYDLVLNGNEIAGGSLRIYQSEIQSAMFKMLGLTPEAAQEKFGFFLEALQYGTPPHGGIAFGVDRLTMILCGVDAIRDVMAFPKTQRGHCLMSESPSQITLEQLAELKISIHPEK